MGYIIGAAEVMGRAGCGGGGGTFTDAAPKIKYADAPFTWTKDVAIAAADVTVQANRVAATGGYAATSLPAGVLCAANTGQLTGTPTAAGSGTAVVSATGPSGNVGTVSIAWTVNP